MNPEMIKQMPQSIYTENQSVRRAQFNPKRIGDWKVNGTWQPHLGLVHLGLMPTGHFFFPAFRSNSFSLCVHVHILAFTGVFEEHYL